MLNLAKKVLSEYKPLLTNMAKYEKEIAMAQTNFVHWAYMLVALVWYNTHSHKIFTTKKYVCVWLCGSH